MHSIRVIPRLDIKGPHLVKGVHLEGLRVLGAPEAFARYYYEHGADELIYIDVVASLYNRNSLHSIIAKTAREIFIPLTVGGGVRSIEDIRSLLRVGADKVSLNTAAIQNPDIIREAAEKFGSSTIIVTIEAIRQDDGKYLAYTNNGREYTGVDAVEWACRVEALGAGEILLTSVDREGTGFGYDYELIRQVSSRLSIPVIASGGAGKINHISEAVVSAGADAVCIASMLHYDVAFSLAKGLAPAAAKCGEGNFEYLAGGRQFSKVSTANIFEIKRHMLAQGILCRYEDQG